MTAPERPDASMSLLTYLVEHPVDEGYDLAARRDGRARGRERRPNRLLTAITALVLGLLVVTAVIEQIDSRPREAAARDDLIGRIEDASAAQKRLTTTATNLRTQVRTVQAQALADLNNKALRDRLDRVARIAATTAVTGPGIEITVDDAPNASGDRGRVLDADLRQVANGLFAAGAEAIAINGHRLTATTAIRTAGSAITVAYVSVSPPYKVVAIGDTGRLPAVFAETGGGAWLAYLVNNYGIRSSTRTERSVTVPAADTPVLRYAKVAG